VPGVNKGIVLAINISPAATGWAKVQLSEVAPRLLTQAVGACTNAICAPSGAVMKAKNKQQKTQIILRIACQKKFPHHCHPGFSFHRFHGYLDACY
jgi:hypothetical protein